MRIIDKSFFIGEILIQGLAPSNSGVATMISSAKSFDIDTYINTYENKFLVGLLGKSLATEFIKELSNDVRDVKWDNLKDQLVLVIDEYKQSPIAYYVYYWYMRSRLTDSAVEQSKEARASNVFKSVTAFNSMVNQVLEFQKWMRENEKTYYKESYTISKELTSYINSLNI